MKTTRRDFIKGLGILAGALLAGLKPKRETGEEVSQQILCDCDECVTHFNYEGSPHDLDITMVQQARDELLSRDLISICPEYFVVSPNDLMRLRAVLESTGCPCEIHVEASRCNSKPIA